MSGAHEPATRRQNELIEQYRILHQKKSRYGRSSERILGLIQISLDDLQNVKTILDYGCGRSRLSQWLAILNGARAYRFDPAIPELSVLPVRKTDLVINTDVLEHVPEDNIDEVLSTLRSLSANAYFHIATSPAHTVLPNGENAHCTVKPTEWWGRKLEKHFDVVREEATLRDNRCSFVTWPRKSIVGTTEIEPATLTRSR